VGGHNIIKMTELKACVESAGCVEVATFIQSGNVIFRSGQKNADALREKIEQALSARFAYESRIVVLTQAQLGNVIARAPDGFGESAGRKHDVIFLREPLSAADAMKSIIPREGVDTVHQGKGVLYISRLVSKLTQSRFPKIASLPIYQHMTIRNWNTTTRLLQLMR
jgi:uncharacterized protein (DUF1697 family)